MRVNHSWFAVDLPTILIVTGGDDMGWLNNMNDVVLDDAAFEKAIADFSDLAVQLQSLRDDIVDLLDVLKKGFDTPAGRKFIRSCEDNLLQPLDKQKLVIDHISATLNDVKTAYATVFTEYGTLNTTIQSYQA